MASKGYYLSKTRVIILIVVVIVLLIFVGLMAGLVGRPDCSSVTPTESLESTSSAEEITTASPAPTEQPVGPWSNIRLPNNLVPTKYDINIRPILEPDVNDVYKFYGSSSVTYTCRNATKYVIMHSNKLNYTKEQVSLKEDANDFMVKNMWFHKANEYVVIETEQPCTEGKTYILSVNNFDSDLSGDLTGIYRSEYTTKDGVKKVIATSQMQPTSARKTFPCFDEPALKANFTVRLWYRANTGYYALSNMPAASYLSDTIDGNRWNSTLFEETVPMSTYLLAMLVVDFPYQQTYTQTNVSIRTYARKEFVDNGETIYAAEITPKILDYIEGYFKVPYSLRKSDQVAVSDFGAAAMENWGISIYRETILLYNDTVSSVFDKAYCTNTIAHELAHQWFGNLVSPAWWDEVWLNEGIATYVSYLGMNSAQPAWKSMELFVTVGVQGAMQIDGLTSSHPLVQSVYSPAEINSQFDTISYSKGSSVLRMINGFMGESNFVGGLTKYLNDLSYKAATHGDLFQHLEDQANNAGLNFPTSLVTILETWTLQMGYPVVNVKKDTATNVYIISQDHFLYSDNATLAQTPGSLTYGYKWYVPFTYKRSSQFGRNESEQMWLEPNKNAVSITEPGYLLANIDAVGYYRVNYDAATWTELINKLNSDTYTEISTENRAQLIDDAFNLARPGILDITVGMDMSKYLKNETEYAPWQTFMGRAESIERVIGRSPIYGSFSNYIVKLVKPLHMKLGWDEPNKDDSAQLERMTIQLAIKGSCYYNSKNCIATASKLYSEWMKDPENTTIISNTYREDVYCAAIRNGGVDEWDFAWERHNATSNAQEKASLRYGMACSKESWILNRYMQYCVGLVRLQDTWQTCIRNIAMTEYGWDLVWAFVVGNWDFLIAKYGEAFPLGSFFDVTTRRFSTKYDLQQLQAFKSSVANLGSARRAVDQAIERTMANIRWRELNEEKLGIWLKNAD